MNMTLTNEYLDDVLVRLAHHSCTIEGNTISLADTISIILHNTIPGSPNKREFYEIENHKGAFEYVLDCIGRDEKMSVAMIKGVHRRLTDRLQHDSGDFKKSENAILGSDIETASLHQVPQLMQLWCDNLIYRLEHSTSNDIKIKIILESHIEFEKIHPFSDGNGRTGRMLMNYLLLFEGIAPLIINSKNRSIYINFLAKEDLEAFFEFASKVIEEESTRIQRFGNKEKYKIDII